MAKVYPEIASHVPQEGMSPVRLHGGPWDGKEVFVGKAGAAQVKVNGPRHGDHWVWITHLYERREGRYEFVRTEVDSLCSLVGYTRREGSGP
jgi:hypothetical protein